MRALILVIVAPAFDRWKTCLNDRRRGRRRYISLPQTARFSRYTFVVTAKNDAHRRTADLTIVIPLAGNFRQIGCGHGKAFVAGWTNNFRELTHGASPNNVSWISG